MKIKLRKPLTYTVREKNGETPEKTETVNEIVLDLDGLTGKDVLDTYRESKTPVSAVSSGFSVEFQATMVSKAARMPIEAILQLNAQDFTTAIMTMQNFLMGGDIEL